MSKQKVRGKDLKKIGCEDAALSSLVLAILKKHYKYQSKTEKLSAFQAVWNNAAAYLEDPVWKPIAVRLEAQHQEQESYIFQQKAFQVYGEEGIAGNALKQMQQAMSLPVVVDGALMPDAHHGYGLPIGGVLATQNAVIPYAVGVDIACRMCLSVYALGEDRFEKERKALKKILLAHSRFGVEQFEDQKRDDPFFDRAEFGELKLLAQLKDKAYQQIGSSGGGNHFVEFGIVEIGELDAELGLPSGRYLALLSHSGSRGFGANIAMHYSKIARQKRQLPKHLAHLSWLGLEEEAGQEYWLAMNMAGDYASACHQHIHQRIAQATGFDTLLRIENHHNFAWEDQLDSGESVIIHRKGATPAHQGELGIIPGSMTAPAFLVRGRGHAAALFSASHGAGRLHSRQEAKNQMTHKMLRQTLQKAAVELIGGGLDEAPSAYKDIFEVMRAQTELVDVLGQFYPKIVRME